MQCPKCLSDNVTIIGNTHYVCNNPDCVDQDGNRTQFKLIQDEKINFPYNQIFLDRSISSFYRKPYLKINDPGNPITTR